MKILLVFSIILGFWLVYLGFSPDSSRVKDRLISETISQKAPQKYIKESVVKSQNQTLKEESKEPLNYDEGQPQDPPPKETATILKTNKKVFAQELKKQSIEYLTKSLGVNATEAVELHKEVSTILRYKQLIEKNDGHETGLSQEIDQKFLQIQVDIIERFGYEGYHNIQDLIRSEIQSLEDHGYNSN